jgi:hypothetical protein
LLGELLVLRLEVLPPFAILELQLVDPLEETLDLGLSLSHLEGVLLGQLEHLLLKVSGNRSLLCRLIARAESLYHLFVLPV